MQGTEFFSSFDAATAPLTVVALGGRLDADTLLAAYRSGCFPWPESGEPDRSTRRLYRRLSRAGRVAVLDGDAETVNLPWCSPDPRAVLLADGLVLSRSLRQRLRRCGWHTTMNQAFTEVMAGCADRSETWITPAMQRAYGALHEQGAAHSLEVWDGERLVGGLYGVLTGRVFSGESMFHREADASKVAVVSLCRRLSEAGVPLVDTQQATAHLASLGQLVVRRQDYLSALAGLRDDVTVLPEDRRPVADG